MRKLFVSACIVSALFVVGAFTYSKWQLSQLNRHVAPQNSIPAVENKVGQDNLNSLPIPTESSSPATHLDSIDPDTLAALGLDLEGLSEEEALKYVIQALEDTIRRAKDIQAEWEAFDRRGEEFERQLQFVNAWYEEEKAKARTIAAEAVESEREMRASLPDSFDYDFEMNLIREQLKAGMSPDDIASALAAKLGALEPIPEIRPGGLPPEEFDPHDPRRAGASKY